MGEDSERNALLASLGFCRMMRWREGDSTPMRMPRSAALEPLCDGFAALRPLAQALRLVEDDALFVTCAPKSGHLPGCSAAVASAGGRFHADPMATAAVR